MGYIYDLKGKKYTWGVEEFSRNGIYYYVHITLPLNEDWEIDEEYGDGEDYEDYRLDLRNEYNFDYWTREYKSSTYKIYQKQDDWLEPGDDGRFTPEGLAKQLIKKVEEKREEYKDDIAKWDDIGIEYTNSKIDLEEIRRMHND